MIWEGGWRGIDGRSGAKKDLWLWYSISLEEARDSESALSVSDCLEDVSTLSEDVGVSSLGGLTGLEVFDVRRGDEVSFSLLRESEFGWNKDSCFALFGVFS